MNKNKYIPNDHLRKMFAKQHEFQLKLGNEEYLYNVPFIKDMILASTCELMEALQETPWKSWKTKSQFNIQKLEEEVIDVWHFVINLSMACGLTDEDIYTRFMAKNKINIDRQKKGY
jgi:dimeric dUTPase (all-alpha-NTP-PPase superfamily)